MTKGSRNVHSCRMEVAPALITYRRKPTHKSGLETIREEINEGSDDDT